MIQTLVIGFVAMIFIILICAVNNLNGILPIIELWLLFFFGWVIGGLENEAGIKK